MTGEEALARARAAIGCRFRPHGRDPAHGFGCVGLAAWAYGVEAAQGYPMRTDDPARVDRAVRAAGLVPACGARPGDLMLMRSGPGQLHLAIDGGNGFVHADAMLRRVVERPGAPPWPVLARWRLQGD